MASSRKRLAGSDVPLSAATGGLIQIDGANALPQMSTTRMIEALAAGDPNARSKAIPGAIPPVLCRFHLKGFCQKASACTFSHEVNGMPTVPIEEKLQTPCRFFTSGQCMRGPACKYAHGIQESKDITAARWGVKKKPKKGEDDGADIPVVFEQPPEPDALAGLFAASGFQSFASFDLQSAGPTDLEARPDPVEDKPAAPMDSAWTAFLSEMAGGAPSGGSRAAGTDAEEGEAWLQEMMQSDNDGGDNDDIITESSGSFSKPRVVPAPPKAAGVVVPPPPQAVAPAAWRSLHQR